MFKHFLVDFNLSLVLVQTKRKRSTAKSQEDSMELDTVEDSGESPVKKSGESRVEESEESRVTEERQVHNRFPFFCSQCL